MHRDKYPHENTRNHQGHDGKRMKQNKSLVESLAREKVCSKKKKKNKRKKQN